MKSINLSLVALLGLLCACSGELESDSTQPSGPQAVSVTQVSVVGEAPASRAIVTGVGYQLGVIRTATPPYTAVWNCPYSLSTLTNKWTSTMPITVDHRPATFYAYYPYHDATGGYAGLSVGTTFDLIPQAYSGAEDICISDAVTAAANGDAAPTLSFLNMQHVYSRIRLTLTRGAASATTSGPYKITNINFTNGTMRFVTRGSQFIESKALALIENLAGWDYNPKINSIQPGTTATTIDLLVPPQSVSEGLAMVFTIDGRRRKVTIPAGQFTGNKLAAGVQYRIALTLTDVAITMDGTLKTEEWWETYQPGGGISIPYEPTERVNWVAVPSVGLKVAKGNLMRHEGFGHWYLAPDQGCCTFDPVGDDYFCYGIDNSYYISGAGATMDGITAGCRAVLGPGWRVPTSADFQKLIRPSCGGDYVGQNQRRNGWYLGTTSAPPVAFQDEYVFLPCTGFRDENNLISFSSERMGYYWTDGPLEYTAVPCLRMTPEGSSVIQLATILGVSVRCVANL